MQLMLPPESPPTPWEISTGDRAGCSRALGDTEHHRSGGRAAVGRMDGFIGINPENKSADWPSR